jgi:hypothetical protein
VRSSEVEVGKQYAVLRSQSSYSARSLAKKVTVLSAPRKGAVRVRFDEQVIDTGYSYASWHEAERHSAYRSYVPFREAEIPVRHLVAEWETFAAELAAREQALALERAAREAALKRSRELAERARELLAERGVAASVHGRLHVGQPSLSLQIDSASECERFVELLAETSRSPSDCDGLRASEGALAELLGSLLEEGA